MALYGYIASELGVRPHQVRAAAELLDAGNTVPFIARYRKEATGELSDEQLRTLEERLAYLRNLDKRREEIGASIAAQGKLTPELEAALAKAVKLQKLEDLYLPYRPKKRTRASIARERGLEPLAEMMLEGSSAVADAFELASAFVTDAVPTPEDALQGASDIVADVVADRADIRTYLRDVLWRDAVLTATLTGDEEGRKQFLQYDAYAEPVNRMPSHRILAVNRGEKNGYLKIVLEAPHETYIEHLRKRVSKGGADALRAYRDEAASDAYKRLLFPAMERELRNRLTEEAEVQAIRVFATNLGNLLMQPPIAGHVIMGLDPGYRTGCKMAIIDAQGNVLDHGTYHLTMSESRREESAKALRGKIRRFGVTLISIGNGTASYETERFVSELIASTGGDCRYLITNEAGASVYSASKLAGEELPDLDVSIRGAVSIARRVQDPLAESVKIDPKSIGVGQYQHDVNQKELSRTLAATVERIVNRVGVELNTASPAILEHVAGLSPAVAKNIIDYRKAHGRFVDRKELLKVARLGPAAFTQCAGFLRIKEGKNPLDETPIHPESYELAVTIVGLLGFEPADIGDAVRHVLLRKSAAEAEAKRIAETVGAGEPTVRDILEALARPGRDPREDLPAPVMRRQVVSLADIKPGTVMKGTVHNVVDFGAFVDIGVKTNGLLHRSRFCKRDGHPSDVLSVGDVIEVEVLSVEADRGRIGLGLKSERRRI